MNIKISNVDHEEFITTVETETIIETESDILEMLKENYIEYIEKDKVKVGFKFKDKFMPFKSISYITKLFASENHYAWSETNSMYSYINFSIHLYDGTDISFTVYLSEKYDRNVTTKTLFGKEVQKRQIQEKVIKQTEIYKRCVGIYDELFENFTDYLKLNQEKDK